MGIHPTSKLDETEIFQCLGHSDWTICSPISHFCSKKFPTFSLSYWEANSYYPREPIMGKGNSSNPKSGWDKGVSVPWAFKLDHLHPIKPLLFWKFSIFFTFIMRGQFLLHQRANNGLWEKGILPTPKVDDSEGFHCLARAFKMDSLHPLKPLMF